MRRLSWAPLALTAMLAGGAVKIVQDQCGPFTDVTPGFCPYVLELYYLGITAGTSATTFSPDDPLTRGQGAVFVAKGINQSLARSSRRAALGQWWTTTNVATLGSTPLPDLGELIASDGQDLWLADGNEVLRVRASDARILETWTGPDGVYGVQVAMGRVFVTARQQYLYMIDPSQPPGGMTVVTNQLGPGSGQIAFDGSRLWVASSNSVSIVTPGPTLPWSVQTISEGVTTPNGILFDGNSVWVTDIGSSQLLRFDLSGQLIQTVSVGIAIFPGFDGENLWLPKSLDNSVAVVRASTGEVITTLTGNGLDFPTAAAFDGSRILISGNSLSVWRATDLAPLGSVTLSAGEGSSFVCSDGDNFWIPVFPDFRLVRF